MNDWWAVTMLVSGGLFAGGVMSIAWERIPAWRRANLQEFRATFAHTLRRVDRLQPALLAVCLVSTIGFGINASGAARNFAVAAAGGCLITLVGSLAWLVPIQRRVVAQEPMSSWTAIENLRAQWLRGHLIRTASAAALFTLAVLAVVV